MIGQRTIFFSRRKPGRNQATSWQLLPLAWADFARISVYSDSINDLPLMERATDPVATNPSAALEAVAAERGWRFLRLFE